MTKELSGRRIVVPETRELDQLVRLLEERGAEAIPCPMIAIRDPPDAEPMPCPTLSNRPLPTGFSDRSFSSCSTRAKTQTRCGTNSLLTARLPQARRLGFNSRARPRLMSLWPLAHKPMNRGTRCDQRDRQRSSRRSLNLRGWLQLGMRSRQARATVTRASETRVHLGSVNEGPPNHPTSRRSCLHKSVH
jgi:hypothetical protein